MTLNTNTSTDYHFPTHAAYLVPVKIKDIPEYGEGQRGVFAMEPIAKGTKLWVWTNRVASIHKDRLQEYIERNFGDSQNEIRIFLRQGFVLPPPSSSDTMPPPHQQEMVQDNDDDDFFRSNPTDSGRLTNHSSNPNTSPDGAIRDIVPGEELTMDYSFHGNPVWYQTICAKYGVFTEAQIAAQQPIQNFSKHGKGRHLSKEEPVAKGTNLWGRIASIHHTELQRR